MNTSIENSDAYLGRVQTAIRRAHDAFKDSGSHEDAELWHQTRDLDGAPAAPEKLNHLLEQINARERGR